MFFLIALVAGIVFSANGDDNSIETKPTADDTTEMCRLKYQNSSLIFGRLHFCSSQCFGIYAIKGKYEWAQEVNNTADGENCDESKVCFAGSCHKTSEISFCRDQVKGNLKHMYCGGCRIICTGDSSPGDYVNMQAPDQTECILTYDPEVKGVCFNGVCTDKPSQ